MPGALGYRVPLVGRFFAKVEFRGEDECWPWTGMRAHGYGYIWREGKMVRAHRLSYEIHVGEIPEGLLVLHSCDNPGCVNPAHLRVGTGVDNSRDAIERGRFVPPPPGGGRAGVTHCIHGHAFYVQANGRKRCRTCENASRRRRLTEASA